MRKNQIFFLILILVVLGPLQAVFAEDPAPVLVPSLCETTIQYNVIKKESPTPVPFDASVVSFQGASEDLAKEGLSKLVIAKKPQVLEACRQQYENTAACMSTKLDSYGSNLKVLSFTARKQMEDSIADDCKKRAGTCGLVSSTEPKCKPFIVATPTPEADAKKPADKGKGKK